MLNWFSYCADIYMNGDKKVRKISQMAIDEIGFINANAVVRDKLNNYYLNPSYSITYTIEGMNIVTLFRKSDGYYINLVDEHYEFCYGEKDDNWNVKLGINVRVSKPSVPETPSPVLYEIDNLLNAGTIKVLQVDINSLLSRGYIKHDGRPLPGGWVFTPEGRNKLLTLGLESMGIYQGVIK